MSEHRVPGSEQGADGVHVVEHRTVLPHPRETVFAWLTSPGALRRLTPPFAAEVVREPEPGLPVGTEAELRLNAPGALGLLTSATHGTVMGRLPDALARLVPQAIAPSVAWTSRHTALEPGHMFRDEMVAGPLASWTHTHTVEDAEAGTCTLVDRIEYRLPGAGALARVPGIGGRAGAGVRKAFESELARQFAYRAAVLRADLAFHAEHPGPLFGGPRRTVAVAGASGMIGTALTALLTTGGHRVVRLVRDRTQASGEDTVVWDPATGTLDPAALADVDAVVNLAGATINGRMTDEHKRAVLDSRLSSTATLVGALHRIAEDGGEPPALVNGSAVGYYGADAGTGPGGQGLTEILAPGEDFLAQVCKDWEAEARRAGQVGARTVQVRTGLVLDPAGGLLQQLMPLFVGGVGGPLARGGTGEDGTPWMSWITLSDIVGIFALAALDGTVHGALNGTAPEPVTSKEFAAAMGTVLHRPAVLPVPAAGPTLLLGREGYETLVAADQKASAAAVEAAGYTFRHRELIPALRHILGR